MFVTQPDFEQYMPATVVGDQRWWRAVTVFATSHWYLFQYVSADNNETHETALVSDEWSLIALVGNIPRPRRRVLGRFQREEPGGPWGLRRVDSLWLPAPIEVEETGVLLVRLEGSTELVDSRMNPVPRREGRRLLYKTRGDDAVED